MPLVASSPKRPKPPHVPEAAPAEPQAVEPQAPAPQPEAKPERSTNRYRAKRVPIYHPYQAVLVPISGSVLLENDNWVQVQVAAKVIICVDQKAP